MDQVVQVDVTMLTFLAGSLVPLLTGVLSKIDASSKVKSILNLGLSLVSGLLAYGLAHSGGFDLAGATTAMISTYLASGVSYQNLWKPTGAAPAIQEATANVGVG